MQKNEKIYIQEMQKNEKIYIQEMQKKIYKK